MRVHATGRKTTTGADHNLPIVRKSSLVMYTIHHETHPIVSGRRDLEGPAHPVAATTDHDFRTSAGGSQRAIWILAYESETGDASACGNLEGPRGSATD